MLPPNQLCFLAFTLFLAGCLPAPTARCQERLLTLEDVVAPEATVGSSPGSPVWSPDSQRLAFVWKKPTTESREIWLVEGDGSKLRPLTKESRGLGQLAWARDGASVFYLRQGELWQCDLSRGTETQHTQTGSRKSDLQVSPDGRFVSFLQSGDLWLLDLASHVLRRATQVGVPSIADVPLGTYDRPDVEIGSYVWGGPTYRWSPDGRTIAVHHVDRRKMRKVPFPYFLGEETLINWHRRGYPGDPNERRTVGLLEVHSGQLRWLKLPDATSTRIVDFSWSQEGVLLIDRESDTATDRWLHRVKPGSDIPQEIWHDHRPTRVYTSIGSAWHPDGKQVLMLSDLQDRYGIYALTPGQTKPTRLTDDRFDVLATPAVPETGQAIYFSMNAPGPEQSQVFSLNVNQAGSQQQVTQLPGHHRPFPSPDGSRVAMLYSNDSTPTELYLASQPGTPARRITVSTPGEFSEHAWANVRYVSFPSRIGTEKIHARIMEPVDLDRQRQYPVIFGPAYSNTARNRWTSRHAMLNQLLVERGYLVVQVDVRGSTGYGRDFREGFLMDFAGKDLEDLHSAVEYMGRLPYVDADRLGIWGSSYGGTLTIYSLLKKPGIFKAGVACAAAVDPAFFGTDDVAIIRRPESHPAGFTRGAIQYAGNLEDQLLIIHGVQDDVVPFKTTVALAEALMREGKDFDFAFAPGATHRWTQQPHHARFLLRKLINHFDRYLTPREPRR